jgi:RNA binding exosome subunit
MKLVNNISFRVFSYPGENKDVLKSSLLSFAGFTMEQIIDEKINFKETNAKGFSQKIIVIMEILLEKERHTNKFLKKLNSILTKEDKSMLIEQVNRLDDNLNFFIRFDKSDLLEGKHTITDSGNCFHVSMNIEAHPRRKDVAHRVVKQIFER